MFTGIIRNVVKLDRLKKSKDDMVLHIRLPFLVDIGDSVSINGACLTVSGVSGKTSIFDVSSETVARSNLLYLHIGDWINVERSLQLSDLVNGHIVYGHVDGVGKILGINKRNGSSEFIIEHPSELSMFIAEKGSIALDGVSLTINEVDEGNFKIVMIEHSLLNTNFKYKKKGDILNIEVDPLARYLKRLLEFK